MGFMRPLSVAGLFALLTFGFGCSSDSNAGSSSAGGTAGGSAAGGSSGSGAPGGLGGTAGSAGSVSACASAPDLGVRFVGRVDGCDSRGARYAWSNSGFVGRFRGTGIAVRLLDTPNQHTVLVDGELLPKLVTSAGEMLYSLASGLAEGEHQFEMYRRTEASSGVTVVQGFEVSDGELLEPPAAAARRIEVIGDSITCGYGDEGKAPCSFSADTENPYGAYAAALARSLDAELDTVAWSGKGVIYNYNGDRLNPLPVVYDRVVPDDRKNPWSFARKPDVVIINLGTNDFSTANAPTSALFTSTYQEFLARLRLLYPEAFILCTVGPMLSSSMLATARTSIAAAVAARSAAGDMRVKAYEMMTPNSAPQGCDSHPNLVTQQAMAAELEMVLRAELGW